MPIVVYQRSHGANDYPLHFAFFEALERRGLLDKADFVVDVYFDVEYASQLVSRFPSLVLATNRHWSRRMVEWFKSSVGKATRIVARLDSKVDAVCEAPGGRLTDVYAGNISNWWLYPNAKRKAVLFHSLESGVLQLKRLTSSLRESDLFIARTEAAASLATQIGCRRVVSSSDIVFSYKGGELADYTSGVAMALRVPNRDVTEQQLGIIRGILDSVERDPSTRYDLVRVEEPIGSEMYRRGYSFPKHGNIRLYSGDTMYHPFMSRRDLIVSCRLHTTIIALLCGNTNIIQAQVESGTSKIEQFVSELGLTSLKVLRGADVTADLIQSRLRTPDHLPAAEIQSAISLARQKVEVGLDSLSEWLEDL